MRANVRTSAAEKGREHPSIESFFILGARGKRVGERNINVLRGEVMLRAHLSMLCAWRRTELLFDTGRSVRR